MKLSLLAFVAVCCWITAVTSALSRNFRNAKADEACTSQGGICLDWRFNKCTAGYLIGLCSGDTNIRCCQQCNSTCANNEVNWSALDSECTAANGTCMINSNFCDGIYSEGKCGGPTNRQCCEKQIVPPGCPMLITRSQWSARPPTIDPEPIGDNLPYQFVHHSDWDTCNTLETCSAEVRKIQDFHMDSRGWNDIGYSFLVGGDGNIYEGRGWNVLGAHTLNYNDVGYGTCFMGNFTTALPEQSALTTYRQYLECATSEGKVAVDYNMYGHRQAVATTCPGNALYSLIQTWPHWTDGNPN